MLLPEGTQYDEVAKGVMPADLETATRACSNQAKLDAWLELVLDHPGLAESQGAEEGRGEPAVSAPGQGGMPPEVPGWARASRADHPSRPLPEGHPCHLHRGHSGASAVDTGVLHPRRQKGGLPKGRPFLACRSGRRVRGGVRWPCWGTPSSCGSCGRTPA